MTADTRQQADDDSGTAVFRNPAVTVDGVVLHRRSSAPGREAYEVLLIERGRDPFRGSHALPGGFVDYGEDIDNAIHREIAEETGLRGLPFRQYRTYGAPDRDPRGHTVSVVYVAVLIGEQPHVVGGDDAAAAGWFPLDRLPPLAFDHDLILAGVLESIKTL